MCNYNNVVTYVNGVEVNDIHFTSSTIQNFRVYGGANEIQDTRLRYWNVERHETTCDGLILHLSE